MPRNLSASQLSGNMRSRSVILSVCLLLAVLLHAPFFLIPSSWLFSDTPLPKKRTLVVQRLYRTSKGKYKRRKVRMQKSSVRRRLAEKRKKKRKEPDPKKVKGQVVDLAPSPSDKAPKDAKYLSQYNTYAKKETVSRHRRLKYKLATKKLLRKKRAKPKKGRLVSRGISIRSRKPFKANPKRAQKAPSKAQKQRKRAAKKPNKRRLAIPKVRKKRRLRLTKSQKARLRYQRKNQRMIPGRGRFLSLGIGKLSLKTAPNNGSKQGQKGGRSSAGAGAPNVVDLRPDFGTLSRIQGAPAPDDIDAPKGEETALNSKRWLYASFFNRVKKLIAQHWNPVKVYQRRDPYLNVYGVKRRTTMLTVTLRANGKLEKLSVSNSSGLTFLDREAMRSIRAASPFPNPPKALVSKGQIRFKFGFTLSLSNKRDLFRIFRR
ncbi:MAG: hypothetical protein CL920_02815 [Deltaproteobacteria bacterium]|nr:hypothetical protein [Deltaproteobacteria bacterium]|tara:strand:- start:1832 stop:3124 length:1293 start_codon:yes stop_codon:yes gene_type:complete